MKKLLLVLLVASQALAVQEYYAIDRSIRALGMGGAFYALSDDESAVFYNPAGLAAYRGGSRFRLLGVQAQVSDATIGALSKVTASGQSAGEKAATLAQYSGQTVYGQGGVNVLSWQMKNLEIALINANVKANVGLTGAGLDTVIDVTAIGDAGLLVGYARPFLNDNLFVGITAKGLVRGGGRKSYTVTDLVNSQTGFSSFDPNTLGGVGVGLDFDLGGTYVLPIKQVGPMIFTRVSLVFNNLLATNFTLAHITGGNPPGLARMATIAGYSAFEGVGPIENFNVLLDLAEIGIGGESNPDLGGRGGTFWKHLNLGVEAPLKGGWVIPRIGFHQGYFTAGITFDVRAAKFDLATYAEELASGVGRFGSRRWAVRMVFGWGSPPPAITSKEGYSKEGMSGGEPQHDLGAPPTGSVTPPPSQTSPAGTPPASTTKP
jgi:hypothetical protein